MPMPTDPPPALDDPSLYLNRELSWLEFNRRVLDEAKDPQVPLLERLKFLAIFSGNLDEFFMVRVGGLMQKAHAGILRSSGADRMVPFEQLERISQTVGELVPEQYRILTDEVLPALEQEGIILRRGISDLTELELTHLRDVFSKDVFPVLTPLAIDPGHPFPHLANKSLNLVVVLERPKHPDKLFAVVQVPAVLRRFVQLPAEKGFVYAPLETAIRMHLADLFPGMTIDHATMFRVTRDSEFEIDDDEVEDLLKAIEESVRKRRRGTPVRLEVEADAPDEVVQFLTTSLELDSAADVFRIPGILDLTSLFQVHSLPGYPHLRDPEHVPQSVADLTNVPSIWGAIRARDILVHHPYESFNHVVEFIETAATDDRVLAIKQTLYRTSSDSPIVRALQRAADRGKQVTAVIELKARLDEERNILWSRELEKSGVHVVFGFVGLKTHCKVALVVRRDDDGIRRYVHLGTGNYNPQTARTYTDLGYFTANPDFADDVSALFNYLTGYSELPVWKKLIVAPSRLQDFMIEKIDKEIELEKSGKGGRIVAKLNGILEPAIVQAIYRASQAGVKVDLICRGICALRPGIPGVSENVRVRSVVDRFLEHSRIFYFGNGGNALVYIGSADWMDRNLSRRVEVVFPIEPPELRERVIREILETSLADNVKARELQSDGTYKRLEFKDGKAAIRSQSRFMELARTIEARREPKLDIPVPPVRTKPIRSTKKSSKPK
ncbi:MAG: polyphosphate kinase 1 [Gemmataceae bacterium]|nr:polyphosphate kinase 1 [Gemmataceae bacterium]